MSEVGIYRISGVTGEIQKLKRAFEKSKLWRLATLSSYVVKILILTQPVAIFQKIDQGTFQQYRVGLPCHVLLLICIYFAFSWDNCHRVRRPSSLFVTKWGSRISRERCDLASPYFTRTFISIVSTTIPDMTSLYASGQKLSTFEKAENDASDGFNLKSSKLAHTSIPTSWSAIRIWRH